LQENAIKLTCQFLQTGDINFLGKCGIVRPATLHGHKQVKSQEGFSELKLLQPFGSELPKALAAQSKRPHLL
jgi:hypothetical protein